MGELQWLVGVSISTVLAIAGIATGAFRAMSGRLDRAVEKMQTAIKDGDDQLHDRINKVRDTYVRRDDHDTQMRRIDETLREVRNDQKEIIRHLAQIAGKP